MKKLILLSALFILLTFAVESNAHDKGYENYDISFLPAYGGLNLIMGSYSKPFMNTVINTGYFSTIANEFNVFATCNINLKTSNNENSQLNVWLPSEKDGAYKDQGTLYYNQATGIVKFKRNVMCGGIE